MHTETHAPPEPQLPPPSPGNESGLSLADEGVLKGHCPTHNYVTYWRSAEAKPTCPECHEALTVIAASAQTAEQAIAAAAEQLPAEKVERRGRYQPTIPGLQPKFDEHAANEMIDAQELVASQAERDHERSNDQTKNLRKIADAENGKLRKLIQDLRARRRDAEHEAALTPKERAERRAAGCLWEQKTGQPCAACRSADTVPKTDKQDLAHLIEVAAEMDADAGIDDVSLVTVLCETGRLFVTVDAASAWTDDDRTAIVNWLAEPDLYERPAVLGTAHVIGDDGTQSCVNCGALLHRLAGELALEGFTAGQLVGTDCSGKPAMETIEELQHLLAGAGAIVALDAIAAWTVEECAAASAWALEQIDANEDAERGRHVSVKWPAHVSAAANPEKEPARRAKPRHASPVARQKARNARTAVERAEKAQRPKAKSAHTRKAPIGRKGRR